MRMKAIVSVGACLLIGIAVSAFELNLKAPLKTEDVVARTAEKGGTLCVFRKDGGKKPSEVYGLGVEGKHGEHFSRGLTLSQDGTLFFCAGPNNMDVYEIPSGKTTAVPVYSFPVGNKEYDYLCGLAALDRNALLVVGQNGIVTRLVRKGRSFEKELSQKIVTGQTHGASIVLDPTGRTAFLVHNWSDMTQSIIAFDAKTLKVVSSFGDKLGITNRPDQLAWIPASPPILAVVNSGTIAVDGKDSKVRHVVGLSFQKSSKEIQPSFRTNLEDGKTLSLFSHADTQNAWLSRADAIAFDSKSRLVFIACRTRTKGANIYSVPIKEFVAGGLTLEKLTPVFATQGTIVTDLAVR